MTVSEIKDALSSLGIEGVTGNKAVLVARLEAARAPPEPPRPDTAMSTATAEPPSPGSEPPPLAPAEPPPPAPPAVFAEGQPDGEDVGAGEINFEPRAKGPVEKRRSSTTAHDLAVPVLQSRLKAALGPKYKLPKKKPDLLALYIEHCEGA